MINVCLRVSVERGNFVYVILWLKCVCKICGGQKTVSSLFKNPINFRRTFFLRVRFFLWLNGVNNEFWGENGVEMG